MESGSIDILKFATHPFSRIGTPLKTDDTHGLLLEKYFKDNVVALPLIHAYDYWLDTLMTKYLKERFIFTNGSWIYLDNVQYVESDKPPKFFRENTRSYVLLMYADIHYYNGSKSEVSEHVHICDIPLMLGSKRCIVGKLRNGPDENLYSIGEDPLDPFGYFIINGTERVVINQEKLRLNKYLNIVQTMTETTKSKEVTAEKIAVIEGIFTYDTHYGTRIMKLSKDSDGSINLYLSFFGTDKSSNNSKRLIVPALLLFKHLELGELGIGEIMENVLKFAEPRYRDLIKVILSRSRIDFAKNGDLHEYIYNYSSVKDKERFRKDFDDNMNYRFLPLAPSKVDMYSFMVCRFCLALVSPDFVDDRDVWAHKRLEWSPKSMENLFVSLFNNVYASINKDIYNGNVITMNTVLSAFNKENMSNTFSKSLAGPKWGKANSKMDRMTEALESKSILNMYSQLSKVNVKMYEKSKTISIRMVQGDQWGFICPTETSEGELCGIVKHMACTAKISLERDFTVIKEKVESWLRTDFEPNFTSPFFLNGYFYGWCNGLELRNHLISLRRSQTIFEDTSIVLEDYDILMKRVDYSYKMLSVYCDSGRPIRPLLVYEYNKKNPLVGGIPDQDLSFKQTFQEMLREGMVEYLDPWESNYILLGQNFSGVEERKRLFKVAETSLKTTSPDKVEYKFAERNYETAKDKLKLSHIELDPDSILGYAANVVPMAERLHAPRIAYQAGMSKQALETEKGVGRDAKYTSAAGTSPNFLTNMNKLLKLDVVAGGRNLHVALMTFLGYNQEDAIIMNRDVADLLYFNYFRNVTKTIEINIDKHEIETVGIPKGMEGLMKNPYYRHLSKTSYSNGVPVSGGYVKIGSIIKADDILVVKFNSKGKNTSVRASIDDEGRVVDVKVREVIGSITTICTIVIKKFYNVQVGDKMAIRYSQKGVIGLILPSVDMPVMENGKPVDMIVNPYAPISRMTVTLLLEFITGNYSALVGERINASTFRNFDAEEFMRRMETLGVKFGYEKMLNPYTGRYFEDPVNVGLVYYQALPHMVASKIQARSTGPIDARTRLVIGGRNRGGGVRAGEMEIDAFISHGALNVTLDRIMLSSDRHDKAVCKRCNQEAWFSKESGNYECKLKCGQEYIGRITIPYSFNRFMDIIRMGSIYGLVNYVDRKEVEDRMDNPIGKTVEIEELETLDDVEGEAEEAGEEEDEDEEFT